MSDTAPAAELRVLPVPGLPELRPGDDLVALLAAAAPWLVDGDVLVVTSKAVSKVEGRLVAVPVDPDGRERARLAAVQAETERVVASRGRTRIVRTRHGFVLASAGVDVSNVRAGEIALLPLDPDASARRLRAGLRAALGVDVAVLVSDTAGRPWRAGLVDVAIGLAGMRALLDLRGAVDGHGNRLQLTETAVADEVAAAADLVKGKLDGVAAAVLRGLVVSDDGRGVRPLVRPADEDMFRLGTTEALEAGRRQILLAVAEPPSAHVDALAVLSGWDDPDPSQRAVREAMIAFLDGRPDGTSRSCPAGHLTASALVLDAPGARVLLALHRRLGRWVQLGGHLEPADTSVLAGAAREAEEESGLPDLTVDPVPVHLDVHPTACSGAARTRHLDVRYLAVAPAGAEPVCSPESLDVRWFPVDRLPDGVPDDLAELVRRARRRLAGVG